MNAPAWQNRIVGYGEEDPEQVLANPFNFRIHPRGQQAQMESILDKVGFVQNVVINKRTQHLVDGHMRVSIALKRGEKSIPVTYIDLDPEEEKFVLATLDPIGDLAAHDREQLTALLEDIGEVEGLEDLLEGLADDAKPPEGSGEEIVDLPVGKAADGVERLEFFLTTEDAGRVRTALAEAAQGAGDTAGLLRIVAEWRER